MTDAYRKRNKVPLVHRHICLESSRQPTNQTGLPPNYSGEVVNEEEEEVGEGDRLGFARKG